MKALVIDIGNTSVAYGIYHSGRISNLKYIDTDDQNDEKIINQFSKMKIDAVAIASVVPSKNISWKKYLSCAGHPKPLWINSDCNLGVEINYPFPKEIGADRLANAAAAVKWIGLPAIICDFGTALTFDIIDQNSGYIGGVICPGLPLMFDYLSEKTENLPRIRPIKSSQNIGKSTKQAMLAGVQNGYPGMINEVLKGIKKDLKVKRINICFTGGDANWILQNTSIKATYFKNLTLMGIGRVLELNS